MEDENGKRVKEAGPSVPVQLTGLSGVPDEGETFAVVESERIAKEIIGHRESERREGPVAGPVRPKLTLEQIFAEREDYRFPTYQRKLSFFEKLAFWSPKTFEASAPPVGMESKSKRTTYQDEDEADEGAEATQTGSSDTNR